MSSHRAFVVALALALTCMSTPTFTVYASPLVQVDSKLLATLENQQRANIFITMKDQFDSLSFRTRSFESRDEQVTALRDSLVQLAEESQKSVTEYIQSTAAARSTPSQFSIRSFWITNQIFVKDADLELVQSLQLRNDVERIDEEVIVRLDDPKEDKKVTSLVLDDAETDAGVLANQWGVDKVRAASVWNMANGTRGEGIVVGVIDTGARHTHAILNGSYANDGFSWFDPVTRSSLPFDDNGHGTHCTGTAVGANGYGVAPGAKWISCKAFNARGEAATSDIIDCFQFMLCPTNPSGSSSNCTKAPHVVNNSWSFTGGGYTGFNSVIERWHAVKIVPVFANGNEGARCMTGGSPADQNTIAVGATTSNDALAAFSSRGPTTRAGIKPDISAPGQLITSASHLSDTGYTDMSGTSMASPHVSGVVALLLSYNRTLTYSGVKDILQRSTERRLTFASTSCGGIRDNLFPNNHFGYGRIDAYTAVQVSDGYSPGGASQVVGFDMAALLLGAVLVKQLLV